jgi:hypothetical protein
MKYPNSLAEHEHVMILRGWSSCVPEPDGPRVITCPYDGCVPPGLDHNSGYNSNRSD